MSFLSKSIKTLMSGIKPLNIIPIGPVEKVHTLLKIAKAIEPAVEKFKNKLIEKYDHNKDKKFKKNLSII